MFSDAGLLGSECTRCGRRHFPRVDACPWCGADGGEPVTLSTTGTLWAWTAVQTPPPGYEGEVPYGFGIVDLPADGLQIVTRLTEADPGRLEFGAPMRFTVVDLTSTTTTYAFTPS